MGSKTTEKPIQALINLRPAEREDFVINGKANIGLEYYVLNQDRSTLSGKHVMRMGDDMEEIASWFKQERVYVLMSCLDKPIKILNP